MLRLLSSFYARVLLTEVKRRGGCETELFESARMSSIDVYAKQWMTYAEFNRLLTAAIALLRDDTLGLLLAARSIPAALGELGTTALAQPSVFDALRVLTEFSRVQAGSVNILIRRTPNTLALRFHADLDLGDMGPFHQEVYVATVQHMVEAIVGRSLTDAQYRFAFPEPEYVQAYKTIFHSPCVFDTTVTEVVLPVYWLKERSPFANSELAERGWRLCARMIRANSERLVNPTAASVEALLTASGKTIPHLDDIARELNCSARSLNRRLATEGVSFRELRKKILCTRAARLLTETTQSVAGIANSLGYQDEAAFYRLFKRQMGVSPGVFRSTQVGLLAQDL